MAIRSCGHAGKPTSITDINPDIIKTQILTRLDGQSLASVACTSPALHAICMNEKVWLDICNSTWTSTKHPRVQRIISSFPGGHRSFFSDSIHILGHEKDRYSICPFRGRCSTPVLQTTTELISVVDIHYGNKLVFSKVEFTDTSNKDFLKSTFQVELLEPMECVRMLVKYDQDDEEDEYLSDLKERMTLSWIVIDPTQKRAVNVSSLRPVTVRPHWIDGDIEVKYASIVPRYSENGRSNLMELRTIVMLEWIEGRELQLRKVNLQVLDMDSNRLSGKDSLVIFQEAIRSGKRKKGKGGEERQMYRKYVDMKSERRERLQRSGGSATILHLATFFLALLIFLALAFWCLQYN